MFTFSKNKTLTYHSKQGKVFTIEEPSLKRVDALVSFVNRLTDEDTYLTFHGQHKTRGQEEGWLKVCLNNIENKKSALFWAIDGDRIAGQVDLERGIRGGRDWHVGSIGLMVDKEFRGDGLGQFLLELILKKAKELDLRIVSLDVFGDNVIALNLYKKFGFKEYGRLPNGLYRKGHYSDLVDMYKVVK